MLKISLYYASISKQRAYPPVLLDEDSRNGGLFSKRLEAGCLDESPKAQCPKCLDTGHVHLPAKSAEGTVFHIIQDRPEDRPCSCHCDAAILLRHRQPEVRPDLPEQLRQLKLSSLKPSSVSNAPEEKQAEWIAKIRENAESNFILCGPSGVGKTTFAAALANHAGWRTTCARKRISNTAPSVWRISAFKLLSRHTERITMPPGEVRPPELLSADLIRSASRLGLRPTLVLEEIDKPRISDTNFGFLYDLIDELHEANGQLIVTSNLRPPDLLAFVKDEPLWRRMLGHGTPHGGQLLNMFADEENEAQ